LFGSTSLAGSGAVRALIAVLDERTLRVDTGPADLLTSFYWDNFIHFGMGPKKGPDGKLAITFPMGDKKLPGIAAEDANAPTASSRKATDSRAKQWRFQVRI
jgi:hypothetical protein